MYIARTAIVKIITEWSGSVEKTTNSTLDATKTAATADPILQLLRQTIMEGFPNEKTNQLVDLRPFFD